MEIDASVVTGNISSMLLNTRCLLSVGPSGESNRDVKTSAYRYTDLSMGTHCTCIFLVINLVEKHCLHCL